MKRLLLFVVLFLLLFASVGMGTFRLLASGKFKNDIFSNFPSLPSSPPPVPMNDLPCNSIPLLITTTCSFTQYNNVDATDSRLTDNTIPAPSCGSYSGSDVWFSALVPSSGEIVIATYSEGTTNWLNKVNFAVYSGSCTSLTEIDCYSANPDLYVTTSDFSGRTPGETLYIRVYDQGNTTGDFQICAAGPCADVVATAGSDDESCDLNFEFSAAAPGSGTGVWSLISGPGVINSFSTNANDPETIVTVSAPGTYNFKWDVNNGTCTDSDTINVIFSQPVFSAPVPNKDVCNTLNSTLTVLSASVGSPEWKLKSGPGTADIDSPGLFTSDVDVSEFGLYIFTLTVTNGTCSASDDMLLNFHEHPLVDAGLDASMCKGAASFEISGSSSTNAADILWSASGDGSFDDVAAENPTYILGGSDTGSVTLSKTADNLGCPSVSDDMILTITEPPTVDAGSDDEICANANSYSISGSTSTNASSINWSSSGNGSFDNANTENPIYTIGSTDAGTVSLTKTVNNLGCPSVNDDMVLTLTPVPIVNAGADDAICATESTYTLTSTSSSNTSSVLWTTSGNGSFDNTNAENPTYTIGSGDTGTVTLTKTGNGTGSCSWVSDDMVLSITPIPTVNAGKDDEICANANSYSISGSTSTNASSINWSTSGNGSFDNANTENPIYTIGSTDAGTVSLTKTVNNLGCPSVNDDMVLTLTPVPIVNAGADDAICTTETTFVLTGGSSSNTFSLVWTTSGDGSFDNASAENPIYTIGSGDTGIVTLTKTGNGTGSCSLVSDDMVLSITPIPTVNAGKDDEICASDNSYSISGSTSTNASSINWSTSGNGSFDNASAENPIYTIGSTDAGTVSLTKTVNNLGCPSVNDDMVLTLTPIPTVNAGADDEICATESTYTLASTSSSNTSSVSWSTSGNGSFDNVNAENPTYTIGSGDAGTVTLTKTGNGTGSCSLVSDDMVLTLTSIPTVNAGAADEICATESTYTLASTSSLNTSSILWSTSGNGSFDNVNAENPIYTIGSTDAGTVTLTKTGNGTGSCSLVSDDMVLSITPIPIVNAGADNEICASANSYSISGSTSTNASSINWSTSGNGSFDNTNAENPIYTIGSADAGTVTLTKTGNGTGSCSLVKDDMILSITPIPIVNAGADDEICATESTYTFVSTSSSNTSSVSWSTSGNGSFNNTSAENPIYAIGSGDAGTVTLTKTGNGTGSCSLVSDDMVLTLTPVPVVNAGTDDEICATESSYTLAGTSSSNTSSVSWFTSGNGSFDNVNAENPIYTIGSTDTGSVTLTKKGNGTGSCSLVSDDMVLILTPIPIVNAGTDDEICATESTYTLAGTSSSNTSSVLWFTSGNGSFDNASAENPIYTIGSIDAGTVTLTKTGNGTGSCSLVSDDMVLTITPIPTVNAGTDDEICTTESTYTLTSTSSSNTSSVSWSTSGNGSFDNANAENPTYTIGSGDAGTVTLTKTGNGTGSCSLVSDDMVLTITPIPTSDAGLEGEECDLNFTLSAKAGVGTGIWSQVVGSGTTIFGDINSENSTTLVDTYGTYIYRWTVINGTCASSSADVTVNYYQIPTVASVGINQQYCDNLTSLSLGGNIPSVGIGAWSQISGPGTTTFSNAGYGSSAATATSFGTYVYRWAISNGTCPSTFADITVSYYQTPSAATVGSDQQYCGVLTSGGLEGNIPSIGIGIWSQISGPGTTAFSNINSGNSTASATSFGTYVYRWTISNGTCSSVNADITVSYYQNPSVAMVGTDQQYCSVLKSTALGGNTPSIGTGIWTQVSGRGTTIFSSINSGSSTATASTYGTYIYRWRIRNGSCTSSFANITVTYYKAPSTASVGANQNICTDLFSTSLGGNTPWVGIGSWSQVSGPGSTIFSDVNFGSSTATASQYGIYTYRWTISSGICTATYADLAVNYNEDPTNANTADDQNYCDVLVSGSLGGNNPVIGNGSWSQISGPGSTNFSSIASGNSTVSVNSFGIYVYRWTITNGICISSDDITVSFNQSPVSNAGLDDNICGGSNYTISGSNSANGTIVWTSSGSGTFDDNTIDNPTYNFGIGESGLIMLTKTVANLGCSSVSDDMTLTFIPAPTADAGLGGNECDLDFNLFAAASEGIGTWTKTTGPGNAVFSPDANTPNAAVSVDAYGIYEFTWTEISAGCADSDMISVGFHQQPITDAGVGGDECDFDYSLAAVQSSGLGTWTKESGPGNLVFTPSSNDPNAVVTTDIYGSYKLRWTEINGSCSDYDEIIVNFYKPPVANAGVGSNECDLDFVFNAIPSIGSGQWTQISGSGTSSFFPNSSFPGATVTVNDFGLYQYLWSETNGNCTDSKMIDVNFYDQPLADAGVDGNMCGLTFSLSAVSSVGSGIWTKISGSGNASFLPNANSSNSVVSVDTYDTYLFRWTEDNGTCSASDEVMVNFYEQPITDAGLGGDQCGLEYSLSAIPSAGIGIWTKLAGSGTVIFTPNANSPNATVMVDAYDSYQFMWSETSSVCSDNDLIDITFQEQPIANAGLDVDMEFADQIQLNAVFTTNGTGEWLVLKGNANLFDPFSPDTFLNKLGLGENILQWTETNQFCSDSDEIKITVNKLFIPTVITPNGDDKNEYFIVRGSDNLGDIQLIIFNREGVEIYTDNNYKNDWNGIDRNGNKLTMDTYFYMLKLKTNKVFKGCIVIKR